MINRNGFCKNVEVLPNLHSVVIKSVKDVIQTQNQINSFTNVVYPFTCWGTLVLVCLTLQVLVLLPKMTRKCDITAHNYPVRN